MSDKDKQIEELKQEISEFQEKEDQRLKEMEEMQALIEKLRMENEHLQS